MKHRKLFLLIASAILFTGSAAFAQESATDTLANGLNKLRGTVDVLNHLKFSGYIQAQYQVADSSGIATFAGKAFPATVDNRFSVRRGRLKVVYTGSIATYQLQFDVTENGLGIKDAFAKLTLPWKCLHSVSLTAGAFNRPFGYEIEYSSNTRETPERGRMSQIIFNNERDLGAMITLQAPKTSRWNFIRADFAMVNGTSIAGPDFDWKKDFIGRIRMDKALHDEKVLLGLGISYYDGGIRQGRKNVWTMGTDSLGLSAYHLNNDTLNFGAMSGRKYMGLDFQLSFVNPVGLTILRAEYISGQQPGTSSTSTSATAQPTTDAYIRNFSGAYFYFVQNIMQTKHQIVAKYDWYDPNVDVAGNDIGAAVAGSGNGKTNKQDIKYTTLGVGYAYKFDQNIKLAIYRDMVTNETSTHLAGFTKDITDDVWTIRLQVKF